MRLFITGLTLFVALCLIAPTGNAFAPQEPSYEVASVVFDNANGDRITSDAQGPSYINGGGLEVRVWVRGSQDLTVGTFRSGRRINFVYTPADPSSNAPSGELLDNAFVNIRNIGAMVVGSTKTTRASFNTAIGYFRWLSGPNPSTGATTDQSYGSQAVVVTRTDPTTWKIRTPVPAESGYMEGIPNPVDYTAGDLSVLLKEAKGKLTPVALYHMPFGLTVTCATCL